MGQESEALKERAHQFALDVMQLVDDLPADQTARYLAHQLVRAANALASNYRATCRARSRAEFVARIGVVAEEADEAAHWLRVIADRRCASTDAVRKLRAEAHELVAIFSSSYGTSRRHLKSAVRKPPAADG